MMRRLCIISLFFPFLTVHSSTAQTESLHQDTTYNSIPLHAMQSDTTGVLHSDSTVFVIHEASAAATARTVATDTCLSDWAPNPKKATLWAIIPGGGQIYNWAHHDKWWLASLKLTVIYGGFTTLTCLIVQNTKDYREFRDAYKWISSGKISGNPNQYTNGNYSADQLKSYMDLYLSNMEWCYFGTGILYILQMVEATVTAHLLTFDVSDDLSFGIKPVRLNIPEIPVSLQTFGLSMRYKINYKQ